MSKYFLHEGLPDLSDKNLFPSKLIENSDDWEIIEKLTLYKQISWLTEQLQISKGFNHKISIEGEDRHKLSEILISLKKLLIKK